MFKRYSVRLEVPNPAQLDARRTATANHTYTQRAVLVTFLSPELSSCALVVTRKFTSSLLV